MHTYCLFPILYYKILYENSKFSKTNISACPPLLPFFNRLAIDAALANPMVWALVTSFTDDAFPISNQRVGAVGCYKTDDHRSIAVGYHQRLGRVQQIPVQVVVSPPGCDHRETNQRPTVSSCRGVLACSVLRQFRYS